MMRVAIVIVTYNSGAEIGGCLDSLRDLDQVEIVVVDNASADDTGGETAARGVRLISNPTNVGFAAAVNLGVRATTAPLVLLLNPDARLVSGLEALIERLADPTVGAAGGMLIGPDGQPQAGFMARSLPSPAALICEVLGMNRVWPTNPVNWHYRCKGLDPMTATLVEQPAGAFLMIRRAVWEQLGGLDERFHPIWFEDVDFCARIKAAKLKVFYEPKAVATHLGGHSIIALPKWTKEQYWYGSLLEYSAKHHRRNSFRMVCLAVMLGSGGRALRGLTQELTQGGVATRGSYGQVAKCALSWFFRTRKGSGVGVV